MKGIMVILLFITLIISCLSVMCIPPATFIAHCKALGKRAVCQENIEGVRGYYCRIL